MEQLLGKNSIGKANVFLDPSHRMPKRPSAVKSGEGLGFQDLGPSFKPSKAPVTYGKPSRGKSRQAGAPPPKTRKAPPPIADDESEDELLLSSQGYATSSPERAANGTTQDVFSNEEETVRVNGRVYKAHPEFKPSSLERLKNLRFTKNKKGACSEDAVAEAPPPSSSMDGSQELFKPISDAIDIPDDSPPGKPSSSRHKLAATSFTRRRSPSVTRAESRRLPDTKDSSAFKLSPPTPKVSPQVPAKPRPQPRVVIVRSRRVSSPMSTPSPAVPRRPFPLSDRSPERPADADGKRTIKKPNCPSPPRREPQEFLTSLQAKENVSDGKKKTGIPRSATTAHLPKPLPLPSPLQAKRVVHATSFPNLSPLHSSKGNGKARAQSSSSEGIDATDDRGKRRGPRPFPMSSHMLAGIDRRRSKSPSVRGHRSAKRTSSDDSGAEQGRTAKKRKDSRLEIADVLGYLNEPMDDDSFDLGHARDPSTLCPYCDEDLPPHPTPFLRQLLSTARKKSYSDPRPKNRGGLKAPLTIYICVCQRHRFESHQLPIAVKKGWPKTIDFAKVPARVKRMKKQLDDIIRDTDDVSDIDDLGSGVGRGARSKSLFWREVKKEMKKQGSRAVVGVKGQFASFEKTQPGYYGEQGSVIIHQTLFDLFPPSTFDASLITPLAPAEFIQRVLVPEAAVRLIAEDLSVDMNEAIVTLRDSAQYGVAMFPDTSENRCKGASADDDEMGVADQIVMERARARRKELAEEEKVEKQMMEEARAAQRARAQESRIEKAIERAQLAKARAEDKVGGREAGEASDARGTRGTRRGPKQQDSDSDAMSVDDLASRRPARTAKKTVRAAAVKPVRVTSRPDGSDSDSVEIVDESKLKGGAGRSKTAERGAHSKTQIATPRADLRKQFGGFAALDSHGEDQSTPRPARQRTNDGPTAQGAVNGLHGRVLPLQMARTRSGASALTTHDGWSRSLRTDVSDDADSDASNANRPCQRLDRPPIKKNGSYSWLLSEASSAQESP